MPIERSTVARNLIEIGRRRLIKIDKARKIFAIV